MHIHMSGWQDPSQQLPFVNHSASSCTLWIEKVNSFPQVRRRVLELELTACHSAGPCPLDIHATGEGSGMPRGGPLSIKLACMEPIDGQMGCLRNPDLMLPSRICSQQICFRHLHPAEVLNLALIGVTWRHTMDAYEFRGNRTRALSLVGLRQKFSSAQSLDLMRPLLMPSSSAWRVFILRNSCSA